jgi:hypothetical protein
MHAYIHKYAYMHTFYSDTRTYVVHTYKHATQVRGSTHSAQRACMYVCMYTDTQTIHTYVHTLKAGARSN